MKKIILSALMLLSLLAFVACGKKAEVNTETASAEGDTAVTEIAQETKSKKDSFELALVTDLGTIDDKSFNQGAWEGLKKYADEKGITYKYYQPQEAGTNAYLETIELAVEGGAKLVVCPGFLFEEPVYLAQEKFPDVHFVLLDGTPHNADYSDFKTGNNTMPILYEEDQAGFLAGYAAVKDGNTKLGFMGGMAVPSVIRFGLGFVQGVDAAAKELNVNCDVQYNYTGQFAATPEAQAMAASWYNSGTEVVFGCGGAVGNSVMAAAEGKNQQEGKFVAKVIGVDVDQYSESDTVITSAMKMLANSVYDAVTFYYDNSFKGGETTTFNVNNNGVGIAIDNARFDSFSRSDYDELYKKVQNNEYTISNEAEEANPAVALKLEKTTVKYIE